MEGASETGTPSEFRVTSPKNKRAGRQQGRKGRKT